MGKKITLRIGGGGRRAAGCGRRRAARGERCIVENVDNGARCVCVRVCARCRRRTRTAVWRAHPAHQRGYQSLMSCLIFRILKKSFLSDVYRQVFNSFKHR